jgi:hypothetical protein
MGFENVALVAFNRGLVSRLAIARTDVKRVALSSDQMVNWAPRVLGSMMLRPGLAHLGTIPSAPRYIPFIFATLDKALCEFTSSGMRIWIDDALMSRVSISGAISNGNFTTDLTDWTDQDEAGATSVWVTGGYMGLTGSGSAAAIRTQTVNIPAPDIVKEHGLRIVIERGSVTLRVGTTSGGDELIAETDLDSGVHSLAVTPNAAVIYVRFLSRLKRQVLVDSCNFEASGVVSITSPYATADLGKLRHDQSASVVFLACYGYQQRVIERRDTRSWSLVRYRTEDGPLRLENTGTVTITPSAQTGNITLTASSDLFRSNNAPGTNNDGSIFRISSNGQNVTTSIAAQNTFTNAITVEGVDNQRIFTVTIDEDAAGAATFTLQRSLVSDTGPWTDVQQWTADVTTPFDDGLDNQLAYYRLGVKTGDYVNGTHAVTLAYTVGSIDGYVRITAYTSTTVVSAEVLIDLGGTAATDDWAEGEWSDRRGWPSAVALYEGRLWWTGKQGVFGSISDSFYSFDEFYEGDAGPINRDVGSGPLDEMNWMLPLSRLVIGAQGAEYSCKSSSLDEPLTPSNFQVKADSTQGSGSVSAHKIDDQGVFVQRGGTRVFNLTKARDNVDYGAEDMTVLVPEVCDPGVSRLAVQRQPDTRIHCVLSDGTVAVAVFDRAENVMCWWKVETRSGDLVEDAVVLPGANATGEDFVYYAVKRTVNGATVRHLEKWALESECRGSTSNKQADAHVTFTNAPASSTITGLTHLVGESVVVWADGKCLRTSAGAIATFVVSAAGEITVTNDGSAYSATTGVVGLAYRARWRSTKLAYAEQMGSALSQRKKFDHLGVILADTHFQGLRYGPDFDNMQELPLVEDGAALAQDTVHSAYDKDQFEFPGEWGPDSRLCLEANAPRCCNILAATLPIEERLKR